MFCDHEIVKLRRLRVVIYDMKTLIYGCKVGNCVMWTMENSPYDGSKGLKIVLICVESINSTENEELLDRA